MDWKFVLVIILMFGLVLVTFGFIDHYLLRREIEKINGKGRR